MLPQIKLVPIPSIVLVSVIESPNTVEVKGSTIVFDQSLLQQNPAPETAMSLQDRWKVIEQKIQRSAPNELRSLYNNVEISEVSVVSEEEFQERNNQHRSNQ
ncbi:MAG: hypothetical protein H9535_10840 [Ignavibacteria bacterium]|nr:hypothetical protein [Ignavibacteria bacterium]